MSAPKDVRADSAGSSAQGPGSRLYLGILALGIFSCALILALVAWQTLRERTERIDREKDALERMTQVVASETEGMFNRIKIFCAAADLWLTDNPRADPRKDPGFVKLVDSFRSVGKSRIDIRLVSEAGGLFYIPSASDKPLVDVGDRDYFKAQSSPATRGLFIGDPVKSRITQVWGIPVSYPLASRNAGMSVIFAAIEMPVILELYDAIRPKPGGSISLIRGDGTFLARAPFDESTVGSSIARDVSAWRAMVAREPKATWIARTPSTDNAERIVSYGSLGGLGMVVSVSSSMKDVLGPWRSDLSMRGLIAALMLGAIGLFSSRLLSALRSLDAAQADLSDNMERLRRSDATKDKLFSVIAHDLRGPIGGMASLLETMATDEGGMDQAQVSEFIDALRTASRNTYQLLENLLAWSQNRRGETPFRPERLKLLPLVEECRAVFDLNAREKGIGLETSVDEAAEAWADPEQLKMLLRNLISNAVKFTARGGEVSISASTGEGGTRIEVRDDGIGMDEAQRKALFEIGAAPCRTGTANERGSGLGLALCKEIAELHGGRIEVRSEPGEGSDFSVFLPERGALAAT